MPDRTIETREFNLDEGADDQIEGDERAQLAKAIAAVSELMEALPTPLLLSFTVSICATAAINTADPMIALGLIVRHASVAISRTLQERAEEAEATRQ